MLSYGPHIYYLLNFESFHYCFSGHPTNPCHAIVPRINNYFFYLIPFVLRVAITAINRSCVRIMLLVVLDKPFCRFHLPRPYYMYHILPFTSINSPHPHLIPFLSFLCLCWIILLKLWFSWVILFLLEFSNHFICSSLPWLLRF